MSIKLTKKITYCGVPAIIGCDAKCEKAWGLNSRPRVQVTEKEGDVAWLADDELGVAPENPGTYEGECGKPRTPGDRMNKWCARECERCSINEYGSAPVEENLELKDLSKRRYNIPTSDPAYKQEGRLKI